MSSAPWSDVPPALAKAPGPPPWDIFCRVIDNLGDVGVCWRLAADLAGRGQPVRLWLDDARALAWMAPGHARHHPGVAVLDWPEADGANAHWPEPGPVVIEAFGCDPPPAFVARMAARQPAPSWINLEYLSAEAHVERCHRLPSPQFSGPGAGLTKTFFYPGFTPATGGLLREPGLLAAQARFDAPAWLAAQGLARGPAERVVSLFCYADSPVEALVEQLATQPTLLLATAGQAAAQVQAALGPEMRRGALRAITLPWLSQVDYDHLLWASDINWVRGEDSAVRAQWAGRPFVWQLYRQDDAAEEAKAEAFLARFLGQGRGAAEPAWAGALRAHWQAWGRPPGRHSMADAPALAQPRQPLAPLPDPAAWGEHCLQWREFLGGQADLVSQLQGFAREAR